MGKYINYSPEDLENAVEAVKSKMMSLRKAAVACGVPKSTLENKLNDKHRQVGAPTFLSRSVETILATLLIFMKNDFIRYFIKFLNLSERYL